MKSGPRADTLALAAIVAEGFLSRLSFGVIGFALPLYAYHLGMHLSEIGLLASINLVVAMALKPAMGVLADRIGLKPSFTAATALRSVVSLALAFVSSPWQLLTVRSVYGISQSMRDPALNALLAEHGGQKRIAAAFGWYSTAKSVGGSLGSAVAGILLGLTASNYSLVFIVAFVLSILPVFIVGRYVQETSTTSESSGRRPEPVGAEPGTGFPGQNITGSASSRVIFSYIVLGTLISGTAQMLRGLLPILATQYAGLSEAETGIVYTASTVVVTFSGPLFGWLSDNVSQKLVLMVRGIANTLSSILFVALPNLAGITLGKVVDDVGKAAFKPAWGALMADVSSLEKKRRTQIISLMCLAEDAGEVGGPIVAGFLWSVWGVPVVLGVRILLALITEIYATVLMASMKRRQPVQYSPPMRASRVVGS